MATVLPFLLTKQKSYLALYDKPFHFAFETDIFPLINVMHVHFPLVMFGCLYGSVIANVIQIYKVTSSYDLRIPKLTQNCINSTTF